MNKKTLGWALAVTLAVVILFGCVVGWIFCGSAVREDRELFISARADYASLRDSLRPVLRHQTMFDVLARKVDLPRKFRPGHYEVKRGMSLVHLVRMIQHGTQTPVRISVHGVRSPQQLAGRLAKRLDADSIAWMTAFTSPEVTGKVGFEPQTLFAMFLPDTYEFYWTVTPEKFIEQMRKYYDRFWTKERDEQRKRSGLSRLEVVTLASIVAEETRKRDEMARVAGVYINRLDMGMPLQADPTVKYALQDFGLRRILHKHLEVQSPYNTYINKGLPPSPICMPDVVAIDAVLGFERHKYIYFCARPTFDGYHSFARTYTEHLSNARAYSAALNKRNIK